MPRRYLRLAFNHSEDRSVLPIVVVMQFADIGLAPLKEVTSKFPHHRELAFIAVVAAWKKVNSAVRSLLHPLACGAVVDKRHCIDLNAARLQYAPNLTESSIKIKEVFQGFRMDRQVKKFVRKSQCADVLVHETVRRCSTFRSLLEAGLCHST